MKIQQLYTNCLAQGAYFIQNNGEAAVVDPLRDVETYVKLAEENNVKIKYIFETHFHADFVSGHIDLAKKTGATIVFGPNAETKYTSHIAKDNEEFKIGNLTIKLLHTPGHTLESSCYLLKNENDEDIAIFTGDTLFIGDVGRPDLAQKGDMTDKDLAGFLFDSLRAKIMTLNDNIVVYPGHGAGSACGKKMSDETVSTIGNQKETNYALRSDMTKEDFIEEVIEGLTTPPDYFPENVALNKDGYVDLDDLMKISLKKISEDELLKAINDNVLLIDTRTANTFEKKFISGSINIGLDGMFAPWVGQIVKGINTPIIIIADDEKEEETLIRLARVGYTNIIGFINTSDFNNFSKINFNSVKSIDPSDFYNFYTNNSNIEVLDVRKPSEYATKHIKNFTNFPLDFINNNIDKLDKNKEIYLHCQGGYRSMIASSILKKAGFENIINIRKGFAELKNYNFIFDNN